MSSCWTRYWIGLGAVFGLLSVVAGALGVHALRDTLDPGARNTFQTATRFQTYHALVLVLTGLRVDPWPTRWWVAAAIQEYILRNASIVRIGTTAAQKSLFFKLRRLRARLAEKPDGPMSDADRRCIAAELKVPLAAVERMEAHFSRPDQSLNAPLGMGESDELQDFLTDSRPTPEDIVLARRDGDTRAGGIEEALARLTPRERQIIAGRFLGDEPMTLAELGEVFGISKERIRQIQATALDKLRATIGEISGDPAELFDG